VAESKYKEPVVQGAVETETSFIRRIFIGPTGFRSGWSFTLYVALFALIVAAGGRWAQSLPISTVN
jgi:hypothetical protein